MTNFPLSKKNGERLLLTSIFFGAALFFLLWYLQHDAEKLIYQEGVYTVEVIGSPMEGFGYTISRKNQLLIVQRTIPAITGNRYFSSAADAQRVGIFALDKLKQGKLPSITKEDLIKLNIIKYSDYAK